MNRSAVKKLHEKFDDDMSWAIHALKILIGENEIRDYILNNKFPGVNHAFTLSVDYTNEDLIKECKKVEEMDIERVAFTVAQKATVGSPTHYIGFLFSKTEGRLYIFDPAMGANGFTYSADEETNIVRYCFKKYSHVFIQPSYTACQTSALDTYCQSWSLWLIIKFLTHVNSGGRLILRKKKGYKVSSINFFNIKKKLEESKRIMYLKRGIFNHVLKLIADDSVDILSTGRSYDLDLEYIYTYQRHLYFLIDPIENEDNMVLVSESVYKTFNKTPLGKRIQKASYYIDDVKKKYKRVKNKIPKARGDLDEAFQLIKVAVHSDFLAE